MMEQRGNNKHNNNSYNERDVILDTMNKGK